MELNCIKFLKFSAYSTRVAYKDGTLYVKRDMVRAYSPVNSTMWAQIMGDNRALEIIESAIYPTVVVTPKNVIWYDMPEPYVEMYEVNSSNINSIGYDAANHILYVEYGEGGIYQYLNVPQDYWNALTQADSKGSWVHWFLKINSEQFPCSKVSGANLVDTAKNLPNSGTAHPSGYMTGFEKCPFGAK